MSVQGDYLRGVAEAIREVEGSAEPIPATDYAMRIKALKGGDGKIEVTCRVTSTEMTGWPYDATVYNENSGAVVVETMKRTFDDAHGDTFTFEVPGAGRYYVLFEFDDGQHYRQRVSFTIETSISFHHQGVV